MSGDYGFVVVTEQDNGGDPGADSGLQSSVLENCADDYSTCESHYVYKRRKAFEFRK